MEQFAQGNTAVYPCNLLLLVPCTCCVPLLSAMPCSSQPAGGLRRRPGAHLQLFALRRAQPVPAGGLVWLWGVQGAAMLEAAHVGGQALGMYSSQNLQPAAVISLGAVVGSTP